ncbi:MAG: methylenetetrahydrofolate reductase [Candidatus Omnitrophota bacterium]|nr:methylenetetrahydrofolate reductase [Candidatus Omnitrophota bacterium]
MIRKISDVLKEKERTYSFEFFPPTTEQGEIKLFKAASEFKKLKPDFFSVTYGAGGGSREKTTRIVDELQRRFDIPAMHHFACIGHSPAELKEIINRMRQKNIYNVLALYGDLPRETILHKPAPDALQYCYQLCEMLRSYGDFFSIGVAGFPEGHVDLPDKETDSEYLKIKLDAGGQFVITQLFFNNRDYFEYLERVRKIGITQRIIPGILPITDYRGLIKFCDNCGATIPKEIHDIFKPLADDRQATYKAGVEFALKQCSALLDGGVPGLHFFTLNKIDPAREILNKLLN